METKDAWITRKIAEGNDPDKVRSAAHFLEKQGKWAEAVPEAAPAPTPTAPPTFDEEPDEPGAPLVSAMDTYAPTHTRASSAFASETGDFDRQIDRYRLARKAEIQRDQPELSDTEIGDTVDREVRDLRAFPAERSGTIADLTRTSSAARLFFGTPIPLEPADETPTERLQRTQQDYADKGPLDMLAAAWETKAAPVTRAEAEAQGLDVDEAPLWRKALGLVESPILIPAATLAQAMIGPEAKIPGVMSLQEYAGLEPAALVTRAAVKSGALDVAASAAEAARALPAEDAQRLRRYLAEARPMDAFDAVGTQLDVADRLAGDAKGAALHDVETKLAALKPREIPLSATPELPDVARYRTALESDPSLRARPGLDRVWAAIDARQSDDHVRDALMDTPIATLRLVDPHVGVTLDDARKSVTLRKEATAATGGEAAARLEKRLGAATLERRGDVYVPSTVANLSRLAGIPEEAIIQADVPLLPGLRWVAESLDADPQGWLRKFAEARVPTKAGLDAALASGAYDDLLPAHYQRMNDPGAGYLARVAAEVANPEFQGAGYQDIYRRAGGAQAGTTDALLGLLDVGVDTFVPFEEIVGAPVLGAARAGARATTAARLTREMPTALRVRAALAGAMPSTYLALAREDIKAGKESSAAYRTLDARLTRDVEAGKLTPTEADVARAKALQTKDVDAETAFHTAVSLGVRDAARRGMDPAKLVPPDVRDEIANVVRAAKRDPNAVAAAVSDYARRARPLYLDTLASMLRDGGTPEQVKLRATPEYQRVRGELDAAVAAGRLTPKDAAAHLAVLEVAAHLAAADFESGVRTPEEFLAKHSLKVEDKAGALPAAALHSEERGTVHGSIEAAPVKDAANLGASANEDGQQAVGAPEAASATPGRTRVDVEASPGFRAWFGESKVRDAEGKPLVVYHGTRRPDRVGNKFDPKRATSGPMAFFTDDPTIASNYATNKADTSLEWPEDYSLWFIRRQKGNRRPLNLREAWWAMTPEERANAARMLPRVGEAEDGTIHLSDEEFAAAPRETWAYELRKHDGNALAAAQYVWLDSGSLFNDEAKFLDVLDKAGVKGFELNDPNLTLPGVYPVYLNIRNPLETNAIPDNVIDALEAASRRTRKRAAPAGADAWDKNAQDPREWMRQLREDRAKGANSYAWTSIPDWVTKTLKDLGYDGIVDTGGKGGGAGHTVWVPFAPTQIKSVANRGTFDPNDPNILHAATGPTIHGSIEPVAAPSLRHAAAFLIRLFDTATGDTAQHELSHFLRFTFGDAFEREFVKHFDHVVTDGVPRLTVKGEEQAAEALRTYLRSRLQPNGRLRAKLDDIGVAIQNAWLRFRREPGLLPAPLTARLDMIFRPQEPVIPATVSLVENALREMPSTRVSEETKAVLEAGKARRAGQAREAGRVDTRPESVRTALGLGANQTEASALDLYADATAYVLTERFRRRWGGEPLVKLTSRTIVPESRVPRILADSRARVRLALGVEPEAIPVKDGVLQLTPAQLAGMATLAQEAADSPMGANLLRAIVDGTAPWTPANYNAVLTTLLDHDAGVAARRSRQAEEVPREAGRAFVKWAADAAGSVGFPVEGLRTAFVVPEIAEGYIDPGVRETLEGLRRDLGGINRWVLQTMRDAKQGNVRESLRAVQGQLRPPVGPLSAATIHDLHGALAGGSMAFDDLVTSLDAMQTALGDGIVSLDDSERAAIDALRKVKATGADLADEATQAVVADATGVLADALRRRWSLVEDRAHEILRGFAGSTDSNVAINLPIADKIRAYTNFYAGDWDKVWAQTSNLGNVTGFEKGTTTAYRPGVALLSVLARLRANEVLEQATRRLAEIGVTADVRKLAPGRPVGEIPRVWETAEGEPMAQLGSSFTDRVHHYIHNEISWKGQRLVGEESGDVVQPPPPPVGGHDLAAYTKAHEILAQWGFKYGKGTWVRRVLPDGTEALLPKMVADELDAAVDRVARVGVAYGEAPGTGQWGRRWSGEATVDLPLEGVGAPTPAQAIHGGVTKVVDAMTQFVPWTLAKGRVGMTTGLLLPNPPNYVGNMFGGLLQMYQGLGLVGTAKALVTEPKVVGALLARMAADGEWWRPTARPIVTRDGRIYTLDALEAVAKTQGLSSSFVAAESAKGLAREVAELHPGFVAKLTAIPGGWQRVLQEAGTAIDNFYRLSTFVDAIKRGESEASAAALARKVAFDYGRLTDWEKRYARNTVMFYSYMRNNLNLFFDTLLTHPSRIMGQMRLLRGMNQYYLGDRGEIIEPGYFDGRLLVGFRQAGEEGRVAHDKAGVATIAPPLPTGDVVNLFADVLDSITGTFGLRGENAADPLSELLARTTPIVQAPWVLGLGVDPFTKRSIDAGKTVPTSYVELDRMATGGILVHDILDVHRRDETDPEYEEAPGQDAWVVGNGRAWWVLHNAVQIPGVAGRSLDTIALLDRADIGFVEAMVEAARWASRHGVTLNERRLPGAGDTATHKAGMTQAEATGDVFGIKHVLLDTEEAAADKLIRKRTAALKGATKQAEAGAPR